MNPSEKELDDSIGALRNYRDRLRNELISISQKLRMPKKKIELTLQEHNELKKIEKALAQLIKQRERQGQK